MFDLTWIAWFLAGSSFVALVFLVATRRKDPVEERLEDLSARGAAGASGGAGGDASGIRRAGPYVVSEENPIDALTSRRLRREEKKSQLTDRLTQAGLYTPFAFGLFMVLRVALLIAPPVIGFLAGQAGYFPVAQGLLFGAMAGIAGTLAPSFWLDHVKRTRQTKIRRALPDALDVMVVCLEGGLSLTGTLSRVARELVTAHPMLAVELNIVERQIRMGHTAGQALRDFAKRFDLEELRSMASVIAQSERIGSSVVGALTVYADSIRVRRHQRAEELANKATVKMIFPTLLCIFPAIFIVILGPAAIQIYQQLILGVMRNIGR